MFGNAVVSKSVAWFFYLSIDLAFSTLDTEFFDLWPNLALKLLVGPHTNITLTSTNYCQVVSSKPGARWSKAWSWDGGAGIKRCNSTSSGSHSISWSMKGWYKPVGVDIEVELKVLTDKFIIQPAVFVVPLQYIRSNWLALYSFCTKWEETVWFEVVSCQNSTYNLIDPLSLIVIVVDVVCNLDFFTSL